VFALFALFGVAAVVAVTFLGHKAEDKLEILGDAATTPQTVDTAHLGAREGDHLVDVGEGVRISGFTATVQETRFAPSFEELPDGSYLVVSVDLENRDDRAQPYDLSHWHLQQPDGALTTPVFADQLTGGSLPPHATVHGRLVFQVGDGTGAYYVTYRPDVLDRGRGIWTIDR
jgi:hypothetical protein